MTAFRSVSWSAGGLAAILILLPVPATFGQNAAPAGGEIQLNTYVAGDQYQPAISRLTGGGFVSAWQSRGSYGTDDSFLSVQARLFDAEGTAAGPEFQVNTDTAGFQSYPAVAGLNDGGFVAVWQSDPLTGDRYSIQGQRFDAGGGPLGDQFRVSTGSGSDRLSPAVAAIDNGGFVVVWHGLYPGDAASSIHTRIYAADGRPLGPVLRLNTYSGGMQFDAAVAGLPGGGFVAAWQSQGSSGSDFSGHSIQARIYTAGGTPLGPQFQVNIYIQDSQANPAVAALPDGGFLAVWQSWRGGVTDDDGYSIQGRRYPAGGAPLYGEFQVNSYTFASQRNAAIATADDGGFVVAWQSWAADGSSDAIRVQRYAAGGRALGGELGVNTTTLERQSNPSVSALPDGGFAVAWQSFKSSAGSDLTGWSVQGQRFEAPRFALSGLGGKCLDVEGAAATDGTPVNIYRCNGGDHQYWRFELVETPQRIVGLGGKCLVPRPPDGSGDFRLVIGACDGLNDLWRLITDGSARPSALIHQRTGLCLDVEGAIATDGTPTVLFECHGDDNQRWRPAPAVCTPDSFGLCLNRERFRVDVDWQSFDGTAGSAKAVPLGSDDSGLLWFFEADNWEMLIKVLDGCQVNDRLWVFAAATTTVEYTLTVTDTKLGIIHEYFNPLGNAAAAITDTGAFATCPAGLSATGDTPPTGKAIPSPIAAIEPATDSARAPGKNGSCIPSLTRMCLSQNRFSLEITWRDYAGTSGSAQVVPMGSEDSGLFWFFDSQNWEMLVKVLDACDVNGRFWLLAAATTDVEYTLRVTDTATGVFREYFNPLGTAAPALVDTFETCPP